MIRTLERVGFQVGALVAALLFLQDANAQVTVSVSAPPAAPGEVTIASVTVNQAAGLAGGDIVISGPDFISAAGPAVTAPATADFLIASRSQPGRIEIAIAWAKGLAEQEATILQIPLQIAKTAPAGAFVLTLAQLQLYDAQPSAIAAKALNGSINVVAAPTDLDNDGLPDSWEMQYLGDIAATPASDSDRDGTSNYHEFVAGTDPAAANSVFRILNLQVVSGESLPTALIQWEGREGRNYQIQWSNGPLGPNMVWHQVYHPDIQKEGSLLSWTDDGTRTHSSSQTPPERYYQIVIGTEPQ